MPVITATPTKFPLTDLLLVDSYSETSVTNYEASAASRVVGNYFSPSSSGTLNSCKFYLKKVGTPTGNINARIYNSGFTALLAESDPIDITTIGTDPALITFNFTGANKITLNDADSINLGVYYNGSGLSIGYDVSGSFSYAQFYYNIGGSSGIDFGQSVAFYLYADPETPGVVSTPTKIATPTVF